MKLIEAMKQVKDLLIKADDLRKKIANHSAILSLETPVYENQAEQIKKWLQAHEDIMQLIGSLQVLIAKTNLNTHVTINFGNDVQVTKSITEWIVRRGKGTDKNGTAMMDMKAWAALTDRNLREGSVPSSSGGEATKVTIRRFYSPEDRDKKVEMYRSEPHLIDSTLEVINAVTDLLP